MQAGSDMSRDMYARHLSRHMGAGLDLTHEPAKETQNTAQSIHCAHHMRAYAKHTGAVVVVKL